MPLKFWNIGKANAEISSGHEAMDAVLASAKILSVKVEGKDTPIGEAPLAVKAAALGALISSGEKSQDVSELIATNGQIAAKLEESEGNAAKATATITSQTQKISSLENQLSVANAGLAKATADNATSETLLKASNGEVGRLTKEANGLNREISRLCLAANCLELTTEDGKALAKEATEEQRLAAADRISPADKLKAYAGALNAAAAKVGITLTAVPSSNGSAASASAGKKLTIDEQIRAAKAKK